MLAVGIFLTLMGTAYLGDRLELTEPADETYSAELSNLLNACLVLGEFLSKNPDAVRLYLF